MSKFTRRDFIHAGCTIASASLVPSFMDRAEAGLRLHGSASIVPPSGLSQRNVINVNFSDGTNDYALIDHAKFGGAMWSPFGAAFTGANPTFSSTLDADGWPGTVASGQNYGGGFRVPDPANFNGPWICDFDHNGTFNVSLQFPAATATFVVGTGSNGMPAPIGCTATGTSSVTCVSSAGAGKGSFQCTFNSSSSGPQQLTPIVTAIGTPAIKNIRWYRAADAADLAAGLIYRRPWKQSLVSLCPSAVRFMNWIGGNGCPVCRWEDRTLPQNAGWSNSTGVPAFNWVASPNYQTDATGNNQIVVAAATPTASNPQTTPANMVHGEIATIRIPSTGGGLRCNPINVTSISNATHGVVSTGGTLSSLSWLSGVVTVTTSTAHNIAPSGTVVSLRIAGASPSGYNGTFSCTITGASTFTYSLASNPGTETVPGTYGTAHGYTTGDIIGHFFSPIQNSSGTLNGTNVISSVLSTISSIIPGMFIFGPGIPALTTVVSTTTSPATITMSNAATLSVKVNFAMRSMWNLHLLPSPITVIDAFNYSLDSIDTTSMGTFSTNSTATVRTYQFQILQVGSGGDRVAYPIMASNAGLPFSYSGNFISPSSYYTGYFDKTIGGQTDGSGNYIPGIWLFDNAGAHNGGVPIEVCTTLINELNAMSPAHTIGMWINIPHRGLSSMDPDYSTSSDWGVNCLDTILNPLSTVRVSGYSALGYNGSSQLSSPMLIVEYSNELWNGPDQKGWLTTRGLLRWPTTYGSQDFQDMQSLRSTQMARDIKAALAPSLLTNVKFVLGMQGTGGMGTTQGSGNRDIAFGGVVTANPVFAGDWYTNDTMVVSQGWGTPISNHDGVSPAAYFDPPSIYYSTVSGTGNFTDDSAMFNGVDNSGTGLSFTGGTGGVSSTTLTTATFTTGSPVLHQVLVGTGIAFPTTIEGISGTSPNFTLTLSQAATVANGTTITSPANGGGNYIGSANPSQANTNFVAAVVDAGNVHSSESPTRYGTILYPQFATQIGPTKVVLSYEGGTDWNIGVGGAIGGGHTLTWGDNDFIIAVIASAQWGVAQTNFFNTVCAIPNVYMPAVYIFIQGSTGPINTVGQTGQRWAYCIPDSYAISGGVPVEGQALLNSGCWTAMSTRNVALTP